ncbi:hypothetical protein BC830DRAFT_525247 [Chytriomyces sp. MP71]|nr:hypothetical protein BC830DRAFT_525247 [Chytriomyces sp. MP71]
MVFTYQYHHSHLKKREKRDERAVGRGLPPIPLMEIAARHGNPRFALLKVTLDFQSCRLKSRSKSLFFPKGAEYRDCAFGGNPDLNNTERRNHDSASITINGYPRNSHASNQPSGVWVSTLAAAVRFARREGAQCCQKCGTCYRFRPVSEWLSRYVTSVAFCMIILADDGRLIGLHQTSKVFEMCSECHSLFEGDEEITQ